MPPPAMFVQQQQQQHIGDGSNILFFFQHFFFQRFSVFSNLKISAPTAAPNSIRKMQQQHRRSVAAGWPRVCVRDSALVVVSICVSSPNPKPNENRVLFSVPPVGPCALEINKLPVHYQSNTGNSCFSFAIAIWHTNTEGNGTLTQIHDIGGEKGS